MDLASAYQRLLEILAEIEDLKMAAAVLYWDQQTEMPPGGSVARGEQLTTLRRLAHEKLVQPKVGELLADLVTEAATMPGDSDQASMIRVAKREYEMATRIPSRLVVAMSEASDLAYHKWLEARAANDFATFVPALERVVALSRETAAALGYEDHPLDALIDQVEPGLDASKVAALFAELREPLVGLTRRIVASDAGRRAGLLHQEYPAGKQLELGMAAVRAIGFDVDRRGRQALSVHPFSISFSPDDTRITTRINRDYLGTSFFALLHEAGHGTYMQGIPDRLRRSILHEGASAGLHESQSRLWENVVGRSRYFWQHFLPVARAVFPSQFGTATVEEAYAAANVVRPSLIRVEADEVTYNLHIMIRFELEKAVLDGTLDLADLPEAWNRKFAAYLGITPPDDLTGVLQDIHWTMRFGGSFQSYTIGNVASIALYRQALSENPGMHLDWSEGRFDSLLRWMQDKVHAHGSKFTPEELLVRATGAGLTAGPYLEHITDKYTELYQL